MVIALRNVPNTIRPEHEVGFLLAVVLLLAALSPVGMVFLAPTIAIGLGGEGAFPLVAADQGGCVVAPAYQPPCPSLDSTVGRSR
jgi:hypothetical protein